MQNRRAQARAVKADDLIAHEKKNRERERESAKKLLTNFKIEKVS